MQNNNFPKPDQYKLPNGIPATLKTGDEKLTNKNNPPKFSLLDFWRWSVSDILSNATRGRFAEFIVATATKIDIEKPRDEWSAFDLETPDKIKLEIKSAAFIQSWDQRRDSTISFGTKASFHLDSITGKRSDVRKRTADVYVFCLLNHNDKQTIDPMNVNQWHFYVLATKELDNYTRSQHSITLKSLQGLTSPVLYDQLDEAIKDRNQRNIA